MFTRILVSCLVHLILVLSVDGVSISLFPESMLAGSNTANPVTRLDMQCSSMGTLDIDSVIVLRLSRRKFSEAAFTGIASIRNGGVAKLDSPAPSDIQSRSPNVTGSVDIDQKSGTLTVSINGQGLTCSDQAEFQCFLSYLDTNNVNPQVSTYKNFTVTTVPNDVLIDSPEYYDNNGNTLQLTNNSALNAGTRIKYRCTANVGSLAAGEIIWERSSELGSLNTFVPYTPTVTTDIVQEDSRQDGCFYRRTSTMYYNLTKFDEDGITFRCKARTYLEGKLYEALANQQFRTVAGYYYNDVLMDSPEYYDNKGNTVQLTNNSVLNEGTRIKYRCAANIDSLPGGEIIWERSPELGSFNMFVPYIPSVATDIVQEASRQDGCFYRRTSTMYYNTTKLDEDGITFRCKARTYLGGQLNEAISNQQFRKVTAPSDGQIKPTTQTASNSDGNRLSDFKSTWAVLVVILSMYQSIYCCLCP